MELQSTPISVDGKADEWNVPLRYYDKNSHLLYEVKNDKENLYVAFSANESSTIMRVLRNGICLKIDTDMGKNDYPLSVTFPFHNDKQNMKRGRDGRLESDQDSLPRERSWRKTNIKLTGFNNKAADTISAKENSLGIEAAMQVDKNSVFCELKIPFASFYKAHLTAKDSIKALFFEIDLAALERSDMHMLPKGTPDDEGVTNHPQRMARGEGASPSGGGRMGGGMKGMGGMGGGGHHGGGQRPASNGEEATPSHNEKQMTPSIFRFEMRPRVN